MKKKLTLLVLIIFIGYFTYIGYFKIALLVLIIFTGISSYLGYKAYKRIDLEYRFYEWFRNSNHKRGTLLAIGNSITAAKYWQYKAGNLLDMNVRSHCKGGIGIITMVDGDILENIEDEGKQTYPENYLGPLTIDEVKNADIIVMLPAYNERGIEYGLLTDMYDTKTNQPNSIYAKMNYAIKRIQELLKEANNKNCKIFIVTPHCVGKYTHVDADGYDEFPSGSGRTMETLANALIEFAKYHELYYIDAYHNSGIDKTNWNEYQTSSQANNLQYIGNNNEHINKGYNEPFKHIEDLPVLVSSGTLATVEDTVEPGYSVYRYDGNKWIKPTIIGNYPWNSDQLHLNKKGCKKLGACIALQIDSILNNIAPGANRVLVPSREESL